VGISERKNNELGAYSTNEIIRDLYRGMNLRRVTNLEVTY
jgi:hypothetical protein